MFFVCRQIVGGERKDAQMFDGYDNPNVVFCGFKTGRELASYYKIADCFVLPTREDIWGLVVNEAISFGLPVVSTYRCGSALEIIKNDTFGELINPTKNDLFDAMARQKSKKHDYKTIQKSAEYYTIDNMAEAFLKVFS